MTRPEQPVRYEAKDGVATITLDRPDVLNAMNHPMRVGLLSSSAVSAARSAPLTAEGAKAFVEKRKPRWTGR